MTVSVPPKCDIPNTDNNDNETCCTDKNPLLLQEEDATIKSNKEKETTNEKLENHNKDKKNEESDTDPKEEIILYEFDDAPEYLKHNIFIRSGYRGILNTKLCLESIFWWTNETINIWSHIFGFALFLALTIYDLSLIEFHATITDKIFVGILLICFQACMILSTLYHTFSCRSEQDCNVFLSFDLFGIALSLLAIYTTGIYYAFWCYPSVLSFYLITITAIFIIAIAVQHPKFAIDADIKMGIFVSWAAYGVIPTLHWSYIMGGFAHPLVALLFPRVLGMYAISGTAFLIYLTKIPERFYAGKFDYLGHSHQWWHLFVVFALYYWHNSGLMYIEYRMNHGCAENMILP